MHQLVNREQFDKLFEHAYLENDNVIYSMLMSYSHNPNNWACWEDFLMDTIFALSAVNKASQEHLKEVLSRQSPTVLIPIANFIPDGAWASDYKN